jgi:hypothetical protein
LANARAYGHVFDGQSLETLLFEQVRRRFKNGLLGQF